MNNSKWKHPYATNTAFDKYETEILNVIMGRTKYLLRAADKPMARLQNVDDSHTVDRENHMLQSAIIAKDIADRLGLNSTIAYIGMLMHDAGHPFGAHEGEEALTIIGKLLNAGFYHHNAKGVDVVLSEDIIGKFIDAIPQAKNNPELKEKLENDVWYFFDVIVGHDGEATREDIKKKIKNKEMFSSVKEAVLNKVSTANRKNIYKCSVETLEGNISKPADVIAYLKSDMADAFRQGIISKFSNEYLICIGKLLFEKDKKELSNAECIEKAKELIEKIKKDKLRETKEDIYHVEGTSTLNAVEKILSNIKEEGIDLFTYDKKNIQNEAIINDVINKYLKKYREQKENKEDINFIESEIHKITDCVQKCLKIRNTVVEDIMTKVQHELITDYCENTEKNFSEIYKRKDISEEEKKELMKESMNFSNRVSDIIYGKEIGLKRLDYKEYVQFTKREYQLKSLPKAVYETVKDYAKGAVNTGLIRDKFYDKTILAMIEDENVKKAMQIPYREEKEYDMYKKEFRIDERKPITKAKIRKEKAKRYINKIQKNFLFNKNKKIKQRKESASTYRKIYFKEYYAFLQRQGERFARTCEDVYYAIPNTVKDLVGKAVSSKYKPNEYLEKDEKEKVFAIRRELKERFGEFGEIAITEENLEKYIAEKIQYERTENFQYNVAAEIAIKQLGGMTDERIKDVLVKMGYVTQRIFDKQDKPIVGENNSVKKLLDSIEENKKEEQEPPKKFRKRMRKEEPPIMVIQDETKER